MQTVRPSPPCHQSTGKFIDDNHLAALNHIIFIACEEVLRPQRLLQVAKKPRLFRRNVFWSIRITQGRIQQLFNVILTNFI